MIPKQEAVEVFSNSTKETNFKINASAAAFKILSSGIYSNKIQAIIRELSCNAYDSHVMLGEPDLPFFVHMPDRWEPYFSVEDFGVGLDDVEIEEVYTSFFTSTKNESNEVIGGLGLGSKSPYSYTDTFTVRARKDGVERVYNMFIGAGGPTYTLLTETDTDERNGVMVTVPVRPDDFYNFNSEARNVFKFFRVLPVFNSSSDIKVDNSEVTELDEQGIIVRSVGYSFGQITAVMGNVGYYIKLSDTIVPRTHTRIWKFMEKTNITVRFGIGDLSVAASRETISFDDETIETFINKLQGFVDGYYDRFQIEVDQKCNTVNEALKYVFKSLGEWGYTMLTYKGESLYDLANKNVVEDFVKALEADDAEGLGGIQVLRQTSYYTSTQTHMLRDTWSGLYKIKNSNLSETSQIAFVMDDTEHGRTLLSTARRYLRETSRTEYVFVTHHVISEAQQQIIRDVLGDCLDVFYTLTELKEEYKVERAKKVVVKVAKDPVIRAKKEEIRVDYWLNGGDATNHNFFFKNEILDLDMLKTKRVMILQVQRGMYEANVLGFDFDKPDRNQSRTMNNADYIMLCKIYKLDYIIVTRAGDLQWHIDKLPDALIGHKVKPSDVKDNDVALLYEFCSSQNWTIQTAHVKIFNTPDYKNLVQTNYLDECFSDYHFRRRNKAAEHIRTYELFHINGFVTTNLCDEFAEKLKDSLSVFNEYEIKLSLQMVLTAENNVYQQMTKKYAQKIVDKVLQSATVVYNNYPLLNHFQYYEIEGAVDLKRQLKDYIEMVDKKLDSVIV